VPNSYLNTFQADKIKANARNVYIPLLPHSVLSMLLACGKPCMPACRRACMHQLCIEQLQVGPSRTD